MPGADLPAGISALFDTGVAESVVKGDAERDEKNSVVIASNESFEGWTKTLTAPRPARPSSTA